MKNRPVEEHSRVDVVAREAAQSLVAAEMGRIREQEQLGHLERRLAGMGWKSRIEWAVKRRSRRRKERQAAEKKQEGVQKKDAEVSAHITRVEMRGNMSRWMKQSRKLAQTLAHELQEKNNSDPQSQAHELLEKINSETVAKDCVGNRGHGLDGGAGAGGMVLGARFEVEGEAQRAGEEIGCDGSSGAAGADDGVGGGRAKRKRRRRCVSSNEAEAAEKCGQGRE